MKSLLCGLLGVIGAFALVPSVSAQAVSETNYRRLAVCDDVLIGGKWYNSFGEGRCPVGTRRPARRSSDPNEQTLRSMNAKVAALGALQQSLLVAAEAANARMMANSDRIINTYEFDLIAQNEGEPLYVEKTHLFPEIGAVSMVRTGDPILVRASGFVGDCIAPNFSMTHTDFASEHVVVEGAVACKLKGRDRAYAPLYVNYTNRINRNNTMMLPWDVVRRGDGNVSLCLTSRTKSACTPARDAASVSSVKAFIVERGAKVPVVILDATEGGRLTFSVAAGAERGPEVVAVDVDGSNTFVVDGHQFEVLARSEEALVYKRIS